MPAAALFPDDVSSLSGRARMCPLSLSRPPPPAPTCVISMASGWCGMSLSGVHSKAFFSGCLRAVGTGAQGVDEYTQKSRTGSRARALPATGCLLGLRAMVPHRTECNAEGPAHHCVAEMGYFLASMVLTYTCGAEGAGSKAGLRCGILIMSAREPCCACCHLLPLPCGPRRRRQSRTWPTRSTLRDSTSKKSRMRGFSSTAVHARPASGHWGAERNPTNPGRLAGVWRGGAGRLPGGHGAGQPGGTAERAACNMTRHKSPA